MGIVNKRNALLGWATWLTGKRVAKRKAKGALSRRSRSSGWPKGRFAVGLAALGGALWFWRRRGPDED